MVRSHNEGGGGYAILGVARCGDCHREHVGSGRRRKGLGSGRGSNVNDEGEIFATVGKEQESSDVTRTVRRLADVREDRQDFFFNDREGSRMASDDSWVQSTECDKELAA